jgi:hypothetical protein
MARRSISFRLVRAAQCRACRRGLSQLLDGRKRDWGEILIHLSACSACNEHWSLLRRAQAELQALPPTRPPAGLAAQAAATALAGEQNRRTWLQGFIRVATPVGSFAVLVAAFLSLVDSAASSSEPDRDHDVVDRVVWNAEPPVWWVSE